MTMERRLSEVLSEFARTLVTDFPIQAILDHLVVRIVGVLPIDAAGVTLIAPDSDPRYVAASNASALRFEQLQTELGEGPCVAAYETGGAISVPDLRVDELFPLFARRAVEEGLAAVFTFPLRNGEVRLGALDLYRTSTGELDDDTMAAAQTLADVAAAYLLNARARAQLHEASALAIDHAMHDALTALPNRDLLTQRLDHAILRCRRSGTFVALMFVDLDRFKAINDTYGHHVGDELLVGVAERLAATLRPGDTLARLAGDEFAVLCEDFSDPRQVDLVARRINESFVEPFVLKDTVVRITASVGIAFAGKGSEVPEHVISDADAAMYQVKSRGGGDHGIFDLRVPRTSDLRAGLNRDLLGALERGELRTEYQPIVSIAAGRVVGVEALLRWDHPSYGTVAPEFCIPLAEHTGLINKIGRWVLEQACVDRHRWQPMEGDRFGIAVNISVNQLMEPTFAATVAAILAMTDTEPGSVTLEMTESIFIQDIDRVLTVLNDLKRIGVMLALDDFGTGYSSLSYLRRFPVDIVKIDRGFIADLDCHASGSVIVSAIVTLAHGLNMTVVAEGVESLEQLEVVEALHCELYQGYYFARPATAEATDALLAPRV